MKNSQKIGMNLTTRQRLSQQQLRFVRMLEMNPDELREAVETELEANPALEAEETPGENLPEVDRTDLGDSSGRGYYLTVSGGSDDSLSPVDREESLSDYLLEQAQQYNLDENERRAVRYLVGSMDSNGYIYRDPEMLRQDMEFREGIVVDDGVMKRAWDLVRSLEPAGVGARDLRDSLLLQIARFPDTRITKLARRILEEQYELFTKKHFDRLASALGAGKEEVADAVRLIRNLNPKPGGAVGHQVSDTANVIVPDFIIDNSGEGLTLTLNNRIPELRISRSFDEAVALLDTPQEKKRGSYVLGQWREARDFIALLNQRQKTLMRVMAAIMKIQREYFETEDVYRLRPMIIKDVAGETGLDLSVISRATANKHVETPWGTFPLRFFFSDTVGDDNGDGADALTNRKIESEIRDIVEKEDKRRPLSDEKIRQAMAERGYDVSRRTVAKYRDRLGIPVARLRK